MVSRLTLGGVPLIIDSSAQLLVDMRLIRLQAAVLVEAAVVVALLATRPFSREQILMPWKLPAIG